MTTPILTSRDGAIATVTLNYPEKRNALTKNAWIKLAYEIAGLDRDEGLRCIVVRGAGDEAFAAGADIAEFPAVRANAEQAMAYGEGVKTALGALRHCRHPTVAMIRGACTGGGLEIAACCDIRISGHSGKFGVPINRIGHAFAPTEMKPIMDLVGRALVLELLLEGRILDAEEALSRGLVNRVVDDDALEDEVAKTAARMTKKLAMRLLDLAPTRSGKATGPAIPRIMRRACAPSWPRKNPCSRDNEAEDNKRRRIDL